jgi:steroid delta-isomerase
VNIGVKMTLESEIRIAGNEAAFAFRLEADTPDGKLTVRPIDVMVFNDEGKVTSMRAFFGPTNQGIES